MTNEEAMREEFDAWHSSNIPQFNGELRYKDVQLGPFDGWQACAEQKDKEIAELSQEIEAGNVGLHHYKKNNDALRAELDTERCISKDLRDDNDMLRENFAGLKNVLHGAQKEVGELSEKILNWERKSESRESKLGQLEANVEVVELREKLVYAAQMLANQEQGGKELRAQYEEKLAAQQAIIRYYCFADVGHAELTAIKAAEYQRGVQEVSNRYLNGYSVEKLQPVLISLSAKLFNHGGIFWETTIDSMPERVERLREQIVAAKQAGREEAEKEAIDQEPVGLFDQYARADDGGKLYRQVYEDGTNEGANLVNLFDKPFPQQKPLSDWQPIETAPKDNKVPLLLACFNDDGSMQSFDTNGSWESDRESWEMPQVYYYWESDNGNVEEPTHWMYQPDFLSRLEAAHGITEKE